MRHSRIYRGIFLGVLLACTVYLIYTIIREPVGSYGLDYILLALGVTAGFIVIDRQKRKKNPADALKRQLKISDSIFLWFQTA